MKHEQDVVECQSDICSQALHVDELWNCADCLNPFCESHIVDLLDESKTLLIGAERDGGSVFVCHACLRERLKVAIASTTHQRKKVA